MGKVVSLKVEDISVILQLSINMASPKPSKCDSCLLNDAIGFPPGFYRTLIQLFFLSYVWIPRKVDPWSNTLITGPW